MKNYFSPGHLIVFVFLLGFMMLLVQVELLSFAFAKLGLSPTLGMSVLMLSLVGSIINLPVTRLKSNILIPENMRSNHWGLLKIPLSSFRNETQVSINLGGCLIPAALSMYLFANSTLTLMPTLLGISIISLISYLFSRPVQGIGIGMPILIAPISAAFVSLLISPEQSAPLAYISGTMGVLIGADLLHLKDIPKLGAPHASIGGAGTFDGIFITGIVAALLV